MAAPSYTQPDWFHDPKNPYAPYYADTPNALPYSTVYDPSTMATLPGTQSRLDAIKLNTQGLDAFRDQALRKGPSPWALLATKKEYANETDARERAKREALGATAGARTDLAMHGGLSSGARERVARSGMRDLLSMSQDVGRQGDVNRLGIDVQDETNRVNQLSMLPGMEQGVFNTDMAKESAYEQSQNNDINRQIGENQAKNAYNTNQYNQQMAAWAAQKQANATENAGKK
jgi:hypothetical protein